MCQPARKHADCTSVAFVTELEPDTRGAFVASATLDLRGATPTSTWCVTATAPLTVTSAQVAPDPVYSYLATYTLTLYRCVPMLDHAYPDARFVAADWLRVTFYPAYGLPVDGLTLTSQVVATVPPDVYTAVLTMSDPFTDHGVAGLPSVTTVEGHIDMSAAGQVLRYC
jgi:hypothetical protein